MIPEPNACNDESFGFHQHHFNLKVQVQASFPFHPLLLPPSDSTSRRCSEEKHNWKKNSTFDVARSLQPIFVVVG